MRLRLAIPLFFGLALASCSKKDDSVCVGCGSCSDGILNQDEVAIDCGGVCTACPSCTDGILNQGESEIDCGGPCANKCPLFYPGTGQYGVNILNYDTLTTVKATPAGLPPLAQDFFSMRAELPSNGTVKVRFINESPSPANVWAIASDSPAGWAIGALSGNMQEFTSNPVRGPIELKIYFKVGGTARIEIFEYNATNPTRVKKVRWGP